MQLRQELRLLTRGIDRKLLATGLAEATVDSNLRAVLIGNHDLPLYRISHPPLFYHKDGHSKIQAAYDA